MVDNVCNIMFLNVPGCFKAYKISKEAVEKHPVMIRPVPVPTPIRICS